MTAVLTMEHVHDGEYWSWQLRGKCLGFPAELFFPEREPRHDLRQREDQAKRICLDCPVLDRCRDHALSTPERYGIWAAMTPTERGVRTSHQRAEKNSR